MNNICLLLLMSLLSSPKDQTNHKHGIHGMLLFVQANQWYVSHLPLFAHPHDQQVLASVTIHGLDETINPQQLMTLVPEPFDLTRINESGFGFTASVYWGHFERVGTLHQSNLSVVIEELLIYQPLGKYRAHHELSYQLIGEPGPVQYYARLIDHRPAADHILRVETSRLLPAQLVFSTQSLHITDKELADELDLPIDLVTTFYLEVDELK
jgi:hypothetical protein